MASVDLYNDVREFVGLTTQVVNTAGVTTGEIIDTEGYESATFVVISGTLTDGTYQLFLQDGDDSGLSDVATVASDYVLPPSDEAVVKFLDTDDDSVRRIAYVGKKRYVRLAITSTTGGSGGTLSAVCVLGAANYNPTDADVVAV